MSRCRDWSMAACDSWAEYEAQLRAKGATAGEIAAGAERWDSYVVSADFWGELDFDYETESPA